jgi:peptide/nickel transport system permease protein
VTRIVIRRLLLGVILLLGVSLLVFLATESLPGNPAKAIIGDGATPAQIHAMAIRLHLNQPLIARYLTWLGHAVRLDFGTSFATGTAVSSYIGPRLVNSMILMGLSAVIATPVAIALGLVTALRRDGIVDHVSSLLSLALAALPEFVVAIGLTLIFATDVFHILPAVYTANGGSVLSSPDQLVLPVLTLGILVGPYITRMTRGVVIEILETDYVEYARLTGVSEKNVVLRNALPNAFGPIVQVLALELAYLAGGIVVVEYVFNYPGIGGGLTDAVLNRDLPMIQALTLIIAAIYVLLNLVADVLSLAADPRVRTATR